jgi:two-component system heavy metal sensor histidine kinase CusS
MGRLGNSFSSLKQFTADFAHELRNPLAALEGEIEVAVSRERSAADYKESLYNCLDRPNWLIKMCQDLLLVSRFDSEEEFVESEWIDLSAILSEMHEFFLPMAEGKNIRMSIGRCDHAWLNADTSLIYRIGEQFD